MGASGALGGTRRGLRNLPRECRGLSVCQLYGVPVHRERISIQISCDGGTPSCHEKVGTSSRLCLPRSVPRLDFVMAHADTKTAEQICG